MVGAKHTGFAIASITRITKRIGKTRHLVVAGGTSASGTGLLRSTMLDFPGGHNSNSTQKLRNMGVGVC